MGEEILFHYTADEERRKSIEWHLNDDEWYLFLIRIDFISIHDIRVE